LYSGFPWRVYATVTYGSAAFGPVVSIPTRIRDEDREDNI